MKYLILIPDYIGSCIRDEFEGEIAIESLGLSEETLKELLVWHNDYRKIIPLSTKEREKNRKQIEELDQRGLKLAKKLKCEINGGAKVKYFSEGRLKYLFSE